MTQLIVTVLLYAAEFFFQKKKDDREMLELFYDFVKRRQQDYLRSAKLRDSAKKHIEKMKSEPWEETGADNEIKHPIGG